MFSMLLCVKLVVLIGYIEVDSKCVSAIGEGGGVIERWALTLSCKFIGLEVKQNVDYGSQV